MHSLLQFVNRHDANLCLISVETCFAFSPNGYGPSSCRRTKQKYILYLKTKTTDELISEEINSTIFALDSVTYFRF